MFTTRLVHVLGLAGLAVAWVDLDPSLIPPIHEALPVFSLGPPSFLPQEWLEGVIGNFAPGVKFTGDHDDSKIYAYDGEEPVGFVDKKSGETRIFPDYTKIKATTQPIDIKHALKTFQAGSEGFPPDDTHLELVQGSSLVGRTVVDSPYDGNNSRRWNDDPESTYFTLATLSRSVKNLGQNFPVCGPGSQATFGVGPDNKILSLSYYWRSAKKNGDSIKPKPVDKAIAAIKKDLEPKSRESQGVKVYHIDACFYDSGHQFLQPVYRVFAKSLSTVEPNRTDTARILRYIPIGDARPEDIVSSPSAGEEPPVEPDAKTLSSRTLINYFKARSSLRQRRGTKPQVTVGRYVTREDANEADFISNANGFWANLQTSSIIDFVNSQYYWAYPRLYGSEANTFVNGVNVVLSESHGQAHLITTFKNYNNVEPVDIPTNLPADGYGPSSGNFGRLAYWFINACEVIPTPIDYPKEVDPIGTAFRPWWPVFRGGLHAVLGWRTAPLFADNVVVNTATAIAQGKPVVAAWLDTAHADPVYNGRPMDIGHLTGILQPLGRAATVYPCGHGSDTVWQVEDLGRPSCLEMRWWNND